MMPEYCNECANYIPVNIRTGRCKRIPSQRQPGRFELIWGLNPKCKYFEASILPPVLVDYEGNVVFPWDRGDS